MAKTALIGLALLVPFQSPPDAAIATRLPPGAEQYQTARYTQSIFQRVEVGGDKRIVRAVKVTELLPKWQASGGMEGVRGVVSTKYRTIPGPVTHKIGTIQVKNSFGYMQPEWGIVRSYPDGTRFDDVLSTPAGVFEHRVAEKVGGKWERSVIYRDEAARPKGYTGLKVSCASCHKEAGTGEYGVGLVPGGDTILSDPLDWTVLRRDWRTEADIR